MICQKYQKKWYQSVSVVANKKKELWWAGADIGELKLQNIFGDKFWKI